MNEDDEDSRSAAVATADEPEDNSAGRLLTLSDGVFAIAMTLLSLDLKVPAVSAPITDEKLRTALLQNSGAYFSFLLSFYVVGSYWARHRRLMRSVRSTHPALIRDTLLLLLIVAVMPFPASLLGAHGNLPTSVAIYCATNVLAGITLMVLSRDVRRLGVGVESSEDYVHNMGSWMNLVVFTLGIPAAYLLGAHGPYIFVLLLLPRRVALARRLFKQWGVQSFVQRLHRKA